MPTERPDLKNQAAAMVELVAEKGGASLTAAQIGPIIEAVMHDLETAADNALVAADRIATLEAPACPGTGRHSDHRNSRHGNASRSSGEGQI